jgi:hypothetical protein
MSAAARTSVRSLATREQFIAGLRGALETGEGFAAGKLGGTERTVLAHPIVLERESDPLRVRAFELVLAHKALRHSGIFPARPEFLRRFGEVFAAGVRKLDSVAIQGGWEDNAELFRFHGLPGHPIDFLDQEPDRSVPADESRCYLPLFRGRRLLLVCPFAELLRDRATATTFEAVWRKTGKPWFDPASVDAVELPYGFSRDAQRRYGDALDLLADVVARIETREFDVALIATGTLGSLIAAAVKERGRVGISLGGHLQVLFGVAGRRWRERPEWQRDYFNEAWIDMPERYKPDPEETDENYW